jgi:hypothetical protein
MFCLPENKNVNHTKYSNILFIAFLQPKWSYICIDSEHTVLVALFSFLKNGNIVLVNKARTNLDNTQSLLIASAIMQSGTVISDHIIPQGHAA